MDEKKQCADILPCKPARLAEPARGARRKLDKGHLLCKPVRLAEPASQARGHAQNWTKATRSVALHAVSFFTGYTDIIVVLDFCEIFFPVLMTRPAGVICMPPSSGEKVNL